MIDPVALEKETGELEAQRRRGRRQPRDLRPRPPDPAAPPAPRGAGRGGARRPQDRHDAARHRAGLRGQGRPARHDASATCCARRRSPDKLAEARRHYEQVCAAPAASPTSTGSALVADLAAFGERQGPRITDVSLVLHRQMAQGYSVLFEGAQATLLDLDHGTYPFVTSSSAAAGGAATGLGVPPTRIDGVLGIAKAYTTRVGAGPLPDARSAATSRRRSASGAASTAPPPGGPRRCGWFDAVAVRYAVRVNGFDTLALTKLDVLDELDEIQVCTGYRFEGELLEEMPADRAVLEACEPVYETLPGWRRRPSACATSRCCPGARRYVERLSELGGSEIGIVSTGPDREETIMRGRSALAGWFDSCRPRRPRGRRRATILRLTAARARSSMVEREPFKLEVRGSIPSGRTSCDSSRRT